MSPQADYVVANGTGAAVRSDINGQLAAIVSNNSGATAPSTTYAYQWWADTTTGLLKLRNAANNGWITLFQLDGEWSTLAVENGSAAAPSIYFKDSGTDTGVYSPGTDQVAISTGGTVRLSLSTTAVSSALAIDHPLGAVGTPSITFTGDLNTGIYSPAADTLAFVEGGVEAMRIDSSGRVGIGSSAPSGGQLVVNSTLDASNKQLVLRDATNGWARKIGVDSSNNMGFYDGDTERMRIDSSGRLLVGTSTAQGNSTVTIEQTGANSAPLALRYTNTNDNQIGIDFYRSRSSSAKVESTDPIMRLDAYGYDGSAYRKGASIEAIIDAATSAGDMPCRLVFSTTADGASSPTERMRITQAGHILFNTSDVDAGISGTPTSSPIASFKVGSGEGFRASTTGAHYWNKANDGDIFVFRRNGSDVGSISVSGGTVSYNQFLGAHWAALTDWSRPEIKIGTILEAINELTDWKYAVIEVEGEQKKICYNGTAEIGSTVTVEYEGQEFEGIVELEADPEFNKAVKVKVNNTAASKAVYGVFVGWNTQESGDGGTWNDMYVGAVGNYVIRMAAGQEPEIGDLVEADGTGCAVVQADDIIRTKTVAKITSTIPQVTYDDGSFLVACVLYCG